MVSSSLPLFPQLAEMSDEEKYGIIARFMPCDLCATCKGWHPYDNNQINCQCGHDTFHHIDNGHDLDRRLKVALRLNELLEEKGKIEDYEYEDEDILSLKNAQLRQLLYDASQMESLSDGSSLSPQGLKRNRDAAALDGQYENAHHEIKRMRSENGDHTETENEEEEEEEEDQEEDDEEEDEEEDQEDDEQYDQENDDNDDDDGEDEEESEEEGQEHDDGLEYENDHGESDEDEQVDDAKQNSREEPYPKTPTPPPTEFADPTKNEPNHHINDQLIDTNQVKAAEEDVDMDTTSDVLDTSQSAPTITTITAPRSTPNTTNITMENDDSTHNENVKDTDDAIITNNEEKPNVMEEQAIVSRMLKEFMPTAKKESPAMAEERQGDIKVQVVLNDGARQSMILLTGLKNIFQKQLPKMPKEYIARLVYDRNHCSIALIRSPHKVIGGICYRPFDEQEFAEIVFCAIASTEQVKGYGSFIMNHLKDYVSGHTNVKHFLTYADNYAVGYFRKQGFTTEITLDKRKWVGYIKDYEGGTIMQCTMVPRVKYLQVQDLLGIQRNAILKKIQEQSTEHVTYPGLRMPISKNGKRSIDPLEVPGIKDSGWTPEMDILSNKPRHSPYYHQMVHIVEEMQNYTHAWPFLEPVSADDVTDYYDIVKDPMDLATLEENVKADAYPTMEDFVKDTQKIFENCKLYNAEDTEYAKCSAKLERFFNEKVRAATRAKNE
ncbi:hypothetical protein [Parasitella parasitica]|uniref:histone acetyltransferase n=1 Tax=Parasitella parasitica TaxID=35722 RepID=A0A0B7N1I7_9FUNG|nr:hypothetical protein [Parasitella parasitica]